eukprot:1647781-Pyramimonas_sp.AAC.1
MGGWGPWGTPRPRLRFVVHRAPLPPGPPSRERERSDSATPADRARPPHASGSDGRAGDPAAGGGPRRLSGEEESGAGVEGRASSPG